MTSKQQDIQPANETESRSVKAVGNATLRFYQGNRFVSEKGSQGNRRVLWTNESAVAQLDGAEEKRLLQADLPGSILGIELQRIAYSPYGHRVIDTVTALLGFNGQRPESMTGGYLLGNGHRMYSPTLMRFCSSDALSPFGEGGINAYAYCSGDPINNVDPSGRALSFITIKSKPGGWLFSKVGGGQKIINDSRVTAATTMHQSQTPSSSAAILPSYSKMPRVGERTIKQTNFNKIDRKEEPPKYIADSKKLKEIDKAAIEETLDSTLIQDQLDNNMRDIKAQLSRNIMMRDNLKRLGAPIPDSITTTIYNLRVVIRNHRQ